MAGMFRVEIIVNPKAGGPSVRKAEDLMDILRGQGIYVRLRGTRFRGHAEALAHEAAAQTVDRLVVAGGDGTINEVINGLAGAPIPLVIIPCGTANVLANELGWPRRVEDIAELLLKGKTRQVNLGSVNGRRFVQMASVGLDAEVVARINPTAKRFFGRLAYVWTALAQLIGRRPQLFDVSVNGTTRRAGAAIAAKGKHYGGAFVVAPLADLASPSFQLVLTPQPGRLAYLRYILALGRGKLSTVSGVETHEVNELTFAGPAGMPIQADGDVIATMPAKIEILRDALTLMVPNSRDGASVGGRGST